MRRFAVCLVAALPLGACATAPERLLVDSRLGQEDPARLINLGYVYMEQGRRDAAVKAWHSALEAPRHRWVETMTGREVRTDQLAREAIARYGRTMASAD
jgi:Tfp pilus assembly protein PilF